MKLFKNLMIVLSVSLLLWGCSDDDESINNGNSTISLSTNILQVDKNGGDATVTVTSSDNWRLSGICDWAHPSITSGKDGDVVTFTIDPNKLDEKRTATFKFFTGSSVVPLQVESQPAYSNHSIFRHDNFIGCFSADKIKKSVRKYFCFNIPVYKNMAEEPSCRNYYHEEYIQTSASGNPEDLCH